MMFRCRGYSTWFQHSTLHLPCLSRGTSVLQKSWKWSSQNARYCKIIRNWKISPLVARLEIGTQPCVHKQSDACLLNCWLFSNRRQDFASEAPVPVTRPSMPSTMAAELLFFCQVLSVLSCFLTSAVCSQGMWGESPEQRPCQTLLRRPDIVILIFLRHKVYFKWGFIFLDFKQLQWESIL